MRPQLPSPSSSLTTVQRRVHNFLVTFHLTSVFATIIVTVLMAEIGGNGSGCVTMAAAQSTSCAFLRQLPYLQNVSVPDEPTLQYAESGYCNMRYATCCTPAIEARMTDAARVDLERAIGAQIRALEVFFRAQVTVFQKHLNVAIDLTRRQLATAFRQTYGLYYADHEQVFIRLFEQFHELIATVTADKNSTRQDSVTDTNVADTLASNFWNVTVILHQFFDNLYIAEFDILNPTLKMSAKQRACVLRARVDFQPFGALPDKVTLLVARALNAWRVVLNGMRGVAIELAQIRKRVALTPSCARVAARGRHCAACAGEAPTLRPCLGYCINALRGCFAAFAEIEQQFVNFVDTLFRLTARLKGVHNPYSFLAPVPAQISEAIMNFQENGVLISKRIQFRCLPPQLSEIRFRFRRRKKRQTNAENAKKNCSTLSESTVVLSRAENDATVIAFPGVIDSWTLWDEEEDELDSSSHEDESEYDENDGGGGDFYRKHMVDDGAGSIKDVHAEADDAENVQSSPPSLAAHEWLELQAASARYAQQFSGDLFEFVDKLRRTRHFWTSIAVSLCEDGEMAAARPRRRRARDGSFFAEAERCWNGSATAAYHRRITSGAFVRHRKFNPEFRDLNENRANESEDLFLKERKKFLEIAAELNACYEDRPIANNIFVDKITEFLPISIDDEDGETNGSGSSNAASDYDSAVDYGDDESAATSHAGAAAAYADGYSGKRFAVFRHPSSNLPVIVTRNLPASTSARIKSEPCRILLLLAPIVLYPLLRLQNIYALFFTLQRNFNFSNL